MCDACERDNLHINVWSDMQMQQLRVSEWLLNTLVVK